MHSTIGAPASKDKPTKSAPLMRLDVFVDTASWFLCVHDLMTIERNRLREMYGALPHVTYKRRLRSSLWSFQCPQPDLIEECERLVEKYNGNLSRLDIAADVRPGSTQLSASEQTTWLREHMLLAHRKKQRVHEEPNEDGTVGTFYVRNAHEKNSPRDLVLYETARSKLHGKPCGHFDLRLRGPARKNAMEDQGVGSLIELDPSILLGRHLRFVQFDRQRQERELFKRLMQGVTLDIAKKRIERAKNTMQLDYVQRWHDQTAGLRLQTDNGLVSFPNRLRWGAVRRNEMKKTM